MRSKNLPSGVALTLYQLYKQLLLDMELGSKVKLVLTDKENVIITPERHENTGRLIYSRHFDVLQISCFPDSNLTITHPAEAGGSDIVLITHPCDSCSLKTWR